MLAPAKQGAAGSSFSETSKLACMLSRGWSRIKVCPWADWLEGVAFENCQRVTFLPLSPSLSSVPSPKGSLLSWTDRPALNSHYSMHFQTAKWILQVNFKPQSQPSNAAALRLLAAVCMDFQLLQSSPCYGPGKEHQGQPKMLRVSMTTSARQVIFCRRYVRKGRSSQIGKLLWRQDDCCSNLSLLSQRAHIL